MVVFSYWRPRAFDKLHGHSGRSFLFQERMFKMKAFLVIVSLIVGLWLFVTYLDRNDLHATAPTYRVSAPAHSASQTHEVVYKILTTDCMTFDVTYEMPGGTSQKSVNACPSRNVVDHLTAKHGDFIYLSAQNTMNPYAGYPQKSFSCTISVDGEAVATVQSSGFASIASCHGRIP
jgi:hypothetical protein